MQFDSSPEKREALHGAFEIMAERYAQVYDAVAELNKAIPEAAPEPAPTHHYNAADLGRIVNRAPNHEDYLRGLQDAA